MENMNFLPETPEFDTAPPLPMNELKDFENNYKKGDLILDSNDFFLFFGEEKESKKSVVIKEYKEEFVKKLKNNTELFDLERKYYQNYNKNSFKYISKFINSYKTNDQIIFVFDKFTTTLRNEIIKRKKFEIEEIRHLFLKINEMIKYFAQRQIKEAIFTPETLALDKKNEKDFSYNLIVYNLFPYQKLKNNKNLTEKKIIFSIIYQMISQKMRKIHLKIIIINMMKINFQNFQIMKYI